MTAKPDFFLKKEVKGLDNQINQKLHCSMQTQVMLESLLKIPLMQVRVAH
jgi:hypothetical protein